MEAHVSEPTTSPPPRKRPRVDKLTPEVGTRTRIGIPDIISGYARGSLRDEATVLQVEGSDQSDELRQNAQRDESVQVCFGMLKDLDITYNDHKAPLRVQQQVPVYITGSIVTLESDRDLVIGKLGPLAAHVLNTLAAQDGIVLQTYSGISNKGNRESLTPEPHTLHAILYGPEYQSEAVGKFLDKCDAYLQDPKYCDRNVLYRNPQSLIQNAFMTRMPQEEPLQQHRQILSDPGDLLTDLETDEQILESETPSALKTELYQHQKQALTFTLRKERRHTTQGPQPGLWQVKETTGGFLTYFNTITHEILYQRPSEPLGGIVADHMGLGKSLSMIALIASDKDEPSDNCQADDFPLHGPKTTLLVVRSSLLQTWNYELKTHVHKGKIVWKFHHGKSRITNSTELQSTDIVITTYQTLLSEWRKHRFRPNLMFITHWHRIILDEAHDIRDSSCVTSEAICALEATSRWALTGTPIQNRLSDLASLYKFLRFFPYDNAEVFHKLVARLCSDSEQGIDKLNDLIRYTMLRRPVRIVQLPERCNILSELDFAPDEKQLYSNIAQRTRDALSGLPMQNSSRNTHFNVLSRINKLLRICTLGVLANVSQSGTELDHPSHGDHWSPLVAQTDFNTLVNAASAACDKCSVDLGSFSTEVMDLLPGKKSQPRFFRCHWLICGPCLEKAEVDPTCQHEPPCPSEFVSTLSSGIHVDAEGASETCPSWTEDKIPTKIKALLQDLRSHLDEEKSVVFSFWTTTLDYIQRALDDQEIRYVRIDGDVPTKKRDAILDNFRNQPSIRVVLLTLSCGAVGLDLTAASRAYLMEPHWNPSVEQQALARVYRMGQDRPVTTTRYIMRDTLEEHVVKVQKGKQVLSEVLLAPNGSSKSNMASQIRLFQHLL